MVLSSVGALASGTVGGVVASECCCNALAVLVGKLGRVWDVVLWLVGAGGVVRDVLVVPSMVDSGGTAEIGASELSPIVESIAPVVM